MPVRPQRNMTMQKRRKRRRRRLRRSLQRRSLTQAKVRSRQMDAERQVQCPVLADQLLRAIPSTSAERGVGEASRHLLTPVHVPYQPHSPVKRVHERPQPPRVRQDRRNRTRHPCHIPRRTRQAPMSLRIHLTLSHRSHPAHLVRVAAALLESRCRPDTPTGDRAQGPSQRLPYPARLHRSPPAAPVRVRGQTAPVQAQRA